MLLVLLGLLSAVHAASEGNFSHTIFGTSSQYHSNSYDALGVFSNRNVLVDARHSDGSVLHDDFTMNRVSLGYRFRGIRTFPVLKAGVLSRNYEGQTTNVPIVTVRGEGVVHKKWYFNYQLGYVPMSEEFQTQFTVREILRGGSAIFGGSYLWSEKWRSTYYLQNYFFNDDNTRLNHDVALFYGLAPGDPWIWVGIGAGRLSNTNTTNGYWVPLEFYTIGPRLDLAFSFREKFRFTTGLNLNYFNDVKSGTGTGYYLNSKLLYKINSSIDLYTGVESIQSKQLGNVWRSNGITVGLTGRW